MIQSAKNQNISEPTLTNGDGTAKWVAGNAFNNVQPSGDYWSSTTNANDTSHAWDVYLGSGSVINLNKSSNFYVWPVRGGQSGSFGSLFIQ